MEKIDINTETINLDQFLKWASIVMTGGEAKNLIQAGKIEVNGEIEKKRGRTLVPGDEVTFLPDEKKYLVSRG
ncbi:MAG: RNA-binding S4 domain-containing protein [Bacillota bacterium]